MIMQDAAAIPIILFKAKRKPGRKLGCTNAMPKLIIKVCTCHVCKADIESSFNVLPDGKCGTRFSSPPHRLKSTGPNGGRPICINCLEDHCMPPRSASHWGSDKNWVRHKDVNNNEY